MCSELVIAAALRRPGFALTLDEVIPLRGVTAISGASGSGKTSLLRIIAGLEPGVDGTLRAFGETWQAPGGRSLAPWRRGVGFVFQDAALFPHLNVLQNLEYGRARRRRGPSTVQTPDGDARDAIIETLKLAALLDRMPGGLSGGERQRVALGRCLMSAPRLILLDEPLSAVDQARRSELIPYLQRSLALAQVPAIHVSHSRSELRQMADRVLCMSDGRITHRGGAELLLPKGAILLDARVLETGAQGTRLDIGWLERDLPDHPAGAALRLMVRADQIVRIAGDGAGVHAAARITAQAAGTGYAPDGVSVDHLKVGQQSVTLPAGGAGAQTASASEQVLALAGFEVLPAGAD